MSNGLFQSGLDWLNCNSGAVNSILASLGGCHLCIRMSLLQNSLGSGIYCREELLSRGKPMASQVQIPFQGVILQEHSAPISCPTPNFAKGLYI